MDIKLVIQNLKKKKGSDNNLNVKQEFQQFLVAKLLYKYKCPSVCPSVCPSTTFRGKRDFSAPNFDKAPFFCADSPHK